MRTPCLALAFGLALLLAGPARAEETRLVVLHTTDLHGSLTAYDYLANRPAPRGLVKLASMVEAARREGDPTLLLDAGDSMQGGAIETVYRQGDRSLPEPMMSAMTRMRYDAMAVGNHEFGFGLAAMERSRAAAGFPWLAANVVRAKDGKPAFPASLVKTLGAVRVGIVGVCTPAVPLLEDPAHYAGLEFLSPVEAARREVARLRERERCDVVLLVAHTGLEVDSVARVGPRAGTPDENWGRRLALEVPGLDVLILGHTHRVLPWAEIGGALVTQAGRWGEHLGRVELTLARPGPQDPWKVTSRRARVLAVSESTDDSVLAAFSEPYHRLTQAALDRVIGHAAREVGAPRGRLEDGPLWDLIHRAQLEATGADVSLAALFEPPARIAAGPVTVRDALRAYPYDNTLGVVELSGAELKETLEYSARALATHTFEAGAPLIEPGMPADHFDSAEGVAYEVDLTRPAGERVLNLTFRGEPLARDRRLKVAVNSYRMNGGGGYEAVRRARRVSRGDRGVRDLLIEHIARAKTLDGSTNRNWRLLPDFMAAPERPLVDLLVRQGILSRDEVYRLRPDERAQRGDLAYWLARAFGWRERRASGAFADVPDSLEPWLDGLLRRRVLGEAATLDYVRPFAPADVELALEWCERAARHERYDLAPLHDPAFRDGLLTGVGVDATPSPGATRGDTLTRSQTLGIVANARFPALRILETTDFHGAILGSSLDRATGRALGGSAVLAAHIERLRAENPHGTMLIDGGDCFQGTMISNLQFGRPVVEQMNALGYAAMAIGNHEFDWSADTLQRRVREMHFAALGANMRERRSGRMPRWVRADTVVSRRGVRVGVLGLCYRETPSVTLAKHVRHLRFEDDSATAARLVPRLRARADLVVGVGHIPAQSDSAGGARGGDLVRLARGIRGVAAWFGGHSHNRVVDTIGETPVMIAGSHGEVVGVCDLVVDPVKNQVVESHARLVLTFADEVTPDSAMSARVVRWNAPVALLASAPVGRNARTLRRDRGGESALGDMVTDAIREATGADIAFQNSGGLRADLPEGVVTKGTVYEVMPFENVIMTMDLTGAEIRRALEQGLSRGRVTQVSGLRSTFDPDRPDSQRVVSVTDASGAPLDDLRLYKVACNDFMATGGDGYNILARGRNRKNTGLLVRDVLEAFIAERSRNGGALDYRLDGRMQRARSSQGRPGE